MKKIIYIATIGITLLTTSCDDFLDRQVPQGIVTGDQIASPEYVDNLVISAYAIWATGDDINSSFSLWNYDVRSDDCYKGGSGTEAACHRKGRPFYRPSFYRDRGKNQAAGAIYRGDPSLRHGKSCGIHGERG